MRSPLVPEIVSAGLVTSDQPWRGVEFHPAIGSTNTRLRELLTGGAPHLERSVPASGDGPASLWWVVLTDHQTGGRGRLGRVWEVPDRASVAVSAAVPVSGPERAGWLPLVAGLALARALREVSRDAGYELTPRLKWPNDVLLADDGDRKVSGILCELVTLPSAPLGDRRPSYAVVVGTGVNVDQTREELPVETATSLALAGVRVGRETLVVAYLRELAALVRSVRPEEAATAYRQECFTIGQRVRVHLPTGAAVEGEALTVDDDGALVVATPEGRRSFAAGDVVHVRRS
ncbi:biotin--[acetyl-CoA-carboxylase] ligase [Intrasporangium mesophilum]